MRDKGKVLQPSEQGWIGRKGDVISTARAEAAGDKAQALSRRSQAMLAAAGMTEPHRVWYVIRVDYRQEKVVDNLLRDAGVEAWLPMEKVLPPRRKGRKGPPPEPVMHVAWPGYMFVRVAPQPQAWCGILGIKHVRSMLFVNEQPIQVSDKEIRSLKVRLEREPEAIKSVIDEMKAGELVRVIDGPLASFNAVFQGAVDNWRVLVDVMIFGRSCVTEMDLAQVSRL